MISIPRGIVWKCITILFFFLDFKLTYPEEVCKLFYNGYPEDLKNKKIVVPDNTVGLSEYIKVGTPSMVYGCTPPGASIFFLIDNSASMTKKDRPANRFNVIHDLIDTIMKAVPWIEVGLAVFKQDLEFNIKDSPYFVKPPKSKRAYLKLMRLDEIYDNYQTGSEIIKKFLRSEIGDNGSGRMKYKPTDPLPYQMNNTNISMGFDAAKHGLKFSPWYYDKQFIIFISDGEANQPQDSTINDFVKGIKVPTTFTIFLSRDGRVPQSIQLMTENIQMNGYSASNPFSQARGYDNSSFTSKAIQADIAKFIMDNIMKAILRKNVSKKPTSISVNGLDPVLKWGDSLGFIFKEIFPLTGTKTDFLLKITYTTFYDSITQTNEILEIKSEESDSIPVNFSVGIDEHAQQQENVLFECWDRKLQFFHNNTPVNIADETMKELEIRFIEEKIDMLYGYEDITVQISTAKTPKTDLEEFKLEDKGSYFSHTFKRECKSTPKHGDKKLDHANNDSIIVTFRNPDLPLDTLRYGIPFHINSITGIKKRQRFLDAGQNYTAVGLTAEGSVNPYDRNHPEKHKIPLQILEILKEDNALELLNSSHPNTGILLRVVPRFTETIDRTAITDIFLEGNVTIFDPTGNTVIKRREMGFHENTKTLNFVFNGRNRSYKTCATGSYLALFKVSLIRGHDRKKVSDAVLKLIVGIK